MLALKFFPASEMAIASGLCFLMTSCIAIIFSASVIPPWMLSVCIQNLFLSVDSPPVTVYTDSVPMSFSSVSLRARYFAHAVATRVDRVPAAEMVSVVASGVARTCGI